jgi:2-oxoisovalerate ferredoxin oxidoreductase gamma subunit
MTLTDVRFHGRGGQGVVTASRLLAEAALAEGKFVHAFPAFGPERAGAPVEGFTRISPKRFTVKTQVYNPHIVVVQDSTLLGTVDVLAGIQPAGHILVNHPDPDKVRELLKTRDPTSHLGVLDASRIALGTIGIPVANTAMLGSVAKMTGVVGLDSITEVVQSFFKGEIGNKNAKAIRVAYQEVREV